LPFPGGFPMQDGTAHEIASAFCERLGHGFATLRQFKPFLLVPRQTTWRLGIKPESLRYIPWAMTLCVFGLLDGDSTRPGRTHPVYLWGGTLPSGCSHAPSSSTGASRGPGPLRGHRDGSWGKQKEKGKKTSSTCVTVEQF